MNKITHDQIVTGQNIIYQHGKANNRIYIMDIDQTAETIDIKTLEEIAIQNQYSKIIGKIPEHLFMTFKAHQFEEEALIPDFYQNGSTCSFMSKYFSQKRQQDNHSETIDGILFLALSKRMKNLSIQISYSLKQLDQSHVLAMSSLYKTIFKSYPFPIFEPGYLLSTFSDVFYFGIFDQEKLVACAACETDFKNRNAEMTDFAVLPEYRGKHLAAYLLIQMEDFMKKSGFKTLYTIARASSPGMNCTFAKLNYTYGGTLINNTQIGGSIESMNVWYKSML